MSPTPRSPPDGHPNTTIETMFLSTCNNGSKPVGTPCDEGVPIENNEPVPPYSIVTDALLLATLHNYSNLILWMAGHRHINTVTPQPAPDGKGPEFGFWEVETASFGTSPSSFAPLKLFATTTIRFRYSSPMLILRFRNGSPADNIPWVCDRCIRNSNGDTRSTDTNPHVYNAELIKPLATPFTMTVTTKPDRALS